MSSLPSISIAIAVYNHFEYLAECIASALRQTSSANEIIIVNDASDDVRVDEYLQDVSSKHKTVRYTLHKKNHGITKTFNKMIKQSKSQYVLFLDCDDYLYDDAIATIREEIVNNRYPDYLFAQRNYVGVKNRQEVPSGYSTYADEIDDRNDHKNNLLIEMIASHPKVIKKDALEKAGLFCAEAGGVFDYDMALKVSEFGALCYIDKILYAHRLHQQSVTQSKRLEQHVLSALVLHHAFDRRRLFTKPDCKDRVHIEPSMAQQTLAGQLLGMKKNHLRVAVRLRTDDDFDKIIPKLGYIDEVYISPKNTELLKKVTASTRVLTRQGYIKIISYER